MIQILDITNLVFTVAFIIEAILKLIGLGAKVYFKDNMNIFDFFIVMLSIVELNIEGGGGISGLRGFRLFRALKLIEKWPSLKRILKSISYTISSVVHFSVLLFLFIYVFSLLGMQFFAGLLKFNEKGEIDHENG